MFGGRSPMKYLTVVNMLQVAVFGGRSPMK